MRLTLLDSDTSTEGASTIGKRTRVRATVVNTDEAGVAVRSTTARNVAGNLDGNTRVRRTIARCIEKRDEPSGEPQRRSGRRTEGDR